MTIDFDTFISGLVSMITSIFDIWHGYTITINGHNYDLLLILVAFLVFGAIVDSFKGDD